MILNYSKFSSELSKWYNELSEDDLLDELIRSQGKSFISDKGTKDDLVDRIVKVFVSKKAEQIYEKTKEVFIIHSILMRQNPIIF